VSTTSSGDWGYVMGGDLGGVAMPAVQFAEEGMMKSEFAMMDSYSIMPEPPRGGDTAVDVDQKIIQTGYLTLLVDKIAEAVPRISDVATTHGGFTQNSNSGEYPNGNRYGSLTIRVPAESYESSLRDIRALALKVVDESTNAQDVTEEYTDLESRLAVAQDEEQAYLALLDRTDSVSDLLQVQRELSNVRARIESLEGRIKYLGNQTELSTITISLEEEASISVPTKPYRFISTVKDAFRGAINIAQSIVTLLVWVVIVGTIIGVPLGVIYWVGRKTWNSRKK
ncbi:DUF4349 domain-containing protein, partial [Candidatus Uhrbacteria bacterium]|nr:DUF4349 domain-containing protein [Candidatus Uhrbacteria bacterium]